MVIRNTKGLPCFAAFVPVAAGDRQWAAAERVIRSLLDNEPSTQAIVIVDDGDSPRQASINASPCEIIVIKNPRPQGPSDHLGKLCVSSLTALDCVHCRFPDVDFVVKLDTDALVIAPFSATLSDAFQESPQAGILGTLGNSANRHRRTTKFDQHTVARLSRAFDLAMALELDIDIPEEVAAKWRLTSSSQIHNFLTVCRELLPLVKIGYTGRHCQGGAYSLSGQLLRKLARAGVLGAAERWGDFPLGEDRMLGCYCALVGMTCEDFSCDSQVFGIQAIGLPFEPRDLRFRNYKIIHSLRNNPGWTEEQIVEFFYPGWN